MFLYLFSPSCLQSVDCRGFVVVPVPAVRCSAYAATWPWLGLVRSLIIPSFRGVILCYEWLKTRRSLPFWIVTSYVLSTLLQSVLIVVGLSDGLDFDCSFAARACGLVISSSSHTV